MTFIVSYVCIEYILPCGEGVNGSRVGPRPNKSVASSGRGGGARGGGVVFAPPPPPPPGPGPAKNQVIEVSCPKAIIET